MSALLPPRIGRYERSVAGSLAGVWENVHDWEHLPWLHRKSFRSIRLLDSGEWGWRARVGLPPRPGGSDEGAEIELRCRAGEEAYDVTTQLGPGAGSVVATRLSPLASDRTGIEVGFHVPGVGGDSARAIGKGFVGLYRRLWDEDEAMIVGRAEAEARRPSPVARTLRIDLGPRSELSLSERSRTKQSRSDQSPSKPFELGGRRFHLTEIDGRIAAHPATCPHRLGPLPALPDDEGCVRCPWHGYRFDLRTGHSADGRGLRLGRTPTLSVTSDGRIEACLEPGP